MPHFALFFGTEWYLKKVKLCDFVVGILGFFSKFKIIKILENNPPNVIGHAMDLHCSEAKALEDFIQGIRYK